MDSEKIFPSIFGRKHELDHLVDKVSMQMPGSLFADQIKVALKIGTMVDRKAMSEKELDVWAQKASRIFTCQFLQENGIKSGN